MPAQMIGGILGENIFIIAIMSRLARKARRARIRVGGAMTDYLIASLSMPLDPIPVIIVLDKIADLIAENIFEGDPRNGYPRLSDAFLRCIGHF